MTSGSTIPRSCMLLAMARYFREVRRLVVMALNGTILLKSTVRRCASNDALGRGIALCCFLCVVDPVGEPLWDSVKALCLEERREVVVGEELSQRARDH